MNDFVKATLDERVDIIDGLAKVFIKTEEPFAFVPGQYISIALPLTEAGELDRENGKNLQRPFSICSTPDEDRLELYIIRVDADGRGPDGKGLFTTAFFELEPGAELFYKPTPKGHYILDKTPDRNIIEVTTGTGLAPAISHKRYLESTNFDKEFHVFHGVRLPEELAYDSEFKAMQDKHANWKYVPCVTRAGGVHTPENRATEMLKSGTFEEALGRKLNPDEDAIYLCGAGQMIKEMRTLLEPKGFSKDAGNLVYELYYQ